MPNKSIKILITGICFVIFFCSELKSQVSISPMFLYFDKDNKTAVMTVVNPTNELREFTLDLKFGYPRYDSLGKWTMIYNDEEMARNHSLVPYLKIFPKKLIIPGKESQDVRFIITNIPSGEDKAYWTRVIASSEPVKKQIDTTDLNIDTTKIRTKIILKTEIVGLLFFINGSATSSVDYDIKRTYKDNNGLHLLMNMNKGGVAPFLGKYILKIYDNNDNKLLDREDKVAIYENSTVDIFLEKQFLIPGKLKIVMTVNNDKEGLPDSYKKSFKPLTKTFYVDY